MWGLTQNYILCDVCAYLSENFLSTCTRRSTFAKKWISFFGVALSLHSQQLSEWMGKRFDFLHIYTCAFMWFYLFRLLLFLCCKITRYYGNTSTSTLLFFYAMLFSCLFIHFNPFQISLYIVFFIEMPLFKCSIRFSLCCWYSKVKCIAPVQTKMLMSSMNVGALYKPNNAF